MFTNRREKIPANSLQRNDRVVIREDELPYLVDSIIDVPDNTVRVTYSSGDIVDYASNEEVTVIA